MDRRIRMRGRRNLDTKLSFSLYISLGQDRISSQKKKKKNVAVIHEVCLTRIS